MSTTSEPARRPEPDMSALIETGRELLSQEAAAIAALDLDEGFLAAIRLLESAPGRVVTAGAGTSGLVAQRLAHLLATSGTPAVFLHPADALHGSLGAVTAGDVVIMVSKGGQSAELNIFASRAKGLGARLLVLTGTPDTPLAALGDVTVTLPPTAADPGGVIAMGSSLAASAWGDALTWVLMRRRGYSWSDVLYTHPAGAVGRVRAEDVAAPEVE